MANPTAEVFVETGANTEIRELAVSLTRKAEEARKVAVVAGLQEDLDAYNKKNGTDFKLLPAALYEVPAELSFAEQTASAICPIKIKDMAFEAGVDYALPVRVMDECAIPGQEVAVLKLNAVTYTKAAKFAGSGTEDAAMFSEVQKIHQWTMEVMVRRANYRVNNRAIAGTKGTIHGSLDEIYTRFGDVTIDPDQLQMKTLSANHDVAAMKFKPNEWYMLSFVYDGSHVKIYVNGQLMYDAVSREGQEYGYTGFWLSGSNEYIREFRFYKVARTDRQIASLTWKTADYNDENLVVYYPMNGKKYDHATKTITEDESKIWDWAKGAHHLNLPNGARFVDDNGKPFVFPIGAN